MKILLILIYIQINAIGFSQAVGDNMKTSYVNLQKVLFVTSDSTYRFTRFIDSIGHISYNQKFVNLCDLHDIYSETFNNPKSTKLHIKFRYINGCDTIKSYFPINKTEFDQDSIINIFDEVECSYRLKQMGEPFITNSKQNIIRIIYPCEELNSCENYNLIRIVFYSDSAKIFSASGTSFDYNGFHLLRHDSCILKRADITKIYGLLNHTTEMSELNCRKPGNPWILEGINNHKYKHFIISNSCIQNKRELNPIALICYSIIGNNLKYFDVNCSIFVKYVNKIKFRLRRLRSDSIPSERNF